MEYREHHTGMDSYPPIKTISVNKNKVIYEDRFGVKSKQLSSYAEKRLFIEELLNRH